MWVYIILIVVGVSLIIAAACVSRDEIELKIGFIVFGIGFLSLGTMLFGADLNEKCVYTSILKGGENPYRMEIQYKLVDSVYIPIDTLIVKIE